MEAQETGPENKPGWLKRTLVTWPLGVAFVIVMSGCGGRAADPTMPSPLGAAAPAVPLEALPVNPFSAVIRREPSVPTVHWTDLTRSNGGGLVIQEPAGRPLLLPASLGDPPPPTLFAPEVTGQTVTLRWTAEVNGCCERPSKYVLQYGFAPGFDGAPERNIPLNSPATVLRADNVSAGTYYVRILAFYETRAGLIGPSNEQVLKVESSAAPPAPRCAPPDNPVLTSQVTGNNVFLAWTRSTSDDRYTLEVNGSILIRDYTNATLTNPDTPDGTYVVRVKTTNACGESGWSNPVTLTIASSPLTITAWSGQISYQSIGGGSYRTTGTLTLTVNRPVSGTLRGQYQNSGIGGTNTFTNATTLQFTLNQDTPSCPNFHNPDKVLLKDANGVILASRDITNQGTGCAFDTTPTPTPTPTPSPTPTPAPAPGSFQVSPTSRDFGTVGGCGAGTTLTLPITITAGSDVSWTVRPSGSDFPGSPGYYSATVGPTSGRGSGTVTLTITIRAQAAPSWSSCNYTTGYNFADNIVIDGPGGYSVTVRVTYRYLSVLGS
jgi:hypothetical protein